MQPQIESEPKSSLNYSACLSLPLSGGHALTNSSPIAVGAEVGGPSHSYEPQDLLAMNDQRTEVEVCERLRANRAAMFAYCSPTVREQPSISVAELDRQITLRKWAQAVVSAPDEQLIDSPEGFTNDELENAIINAINAMYRSSKLPVIEGGQGRSAEELLRSGLELFFIILAIVIFIGLCFYFI